MKLFSLRNVFLINLMILICTGTSAFAQDNAARIPWNKNQAVSPAVFASELASGKADSVLIINVGPVDNIEGAVRVGPLSGKKNEEHLTELLKEVPKNQPIVIYCGCCPMARCPNIRPAYHFLEDNGFTNFRILDIGESLAADWISKGYPMGDNDKH